MGKLHAIVLDDCDIDQYFATQTLQKTGWFDDIEQFLDPRQVLNFLAECRYQRQQVDLLLSDFRMPYLNGLEFFSKLYAAELQQTVRHASMMLTVPLLPREEQALHSLDPSIGFLTKPLAETAIKQALLH